MAVAVAMANGGDGRARVRCGERAEEGREGVDRPEGLGRLHGASSQPPASAEAGGGSGACRRAASDWRELDDDWQR